MKNINSIMVSIIGDDGFSLTGRKFEIIIFIIENIRE